MASFAISEFSRDKFSLLQQHTHSFFQFWFSHTRTHTLLVSQVYNIVLTTSNQNQNHSDSKTVGLSLLVCTYNQTK